MFVVALFPKRCVAPCIVANIPQPLPILSYAPDAAAIADRKELSTVDQALAVDFNSTTGSTGGSCREGRRGGGEVQGCCQVEPGKARVDPGAHA